MRLDKGLVIYTILVLGLMTLFSLILFLSNVPTLYLGLFFAAFMYIPIFSAIIVIKLVDKGSLEEYGISKNIEIKLVPAFLSVIFPFIVIGLTIPFAFAMGAKIDLTMSTFFAQLEEISTRLGVPMDVLILGQIINIILAPFINTIFAYGEEAGWRGYLYDKLKRDYGLEWGLILTGLIWGLWHWPLIFLFGYNYPHHPDLVGGTLFVLFCIGLGVFLSWLKEVTGNVIYPALGHGAINAYLGFGVYIVLVEDELYGFPGIPVVISLLILAAIFYYMIERSG